MSSLGEVGGGSSAFAGSAGSAQPYGRMRRLLFFAAGTDLRLLRRVPVEEESQAQLGSAVWLAAALAGVGATLAASYWGQGEVVLRWNYLVTGLLVGGLVFSVDKLLVRLPLNPYRFPPEITAALRSPVAELRETAAGAIFEPSKVGRARQARSLVVPASIRVLISICLSYIIGTLLLFVFFSPELKQRVAYINATTIQQLIARTNTTYDQREARIQRDIAATSAAGGPAVQKAQKALTAQQNRLTQLNSDIATLNAAYIAETHGLSRRFVLSHGDVVVTSGVSGRGTTAASIRAEISNLESAQKTAAGQVAAGKERLAAADKASEGVAGSNARRLVELNAQLAALEQQRENALRHVAPSTPLAHGILLQVEALDQLEHDATPQTGTVDPPSPCHSFACRMLRSIVPATPLGAWVVVVRLLLIAIDLLPIVVKIHMSLRQRRPYDALRAAEEEIALAETHDLVHRELLERRLRVERRIQDLPGPDPQPAV